MGHSSATKTVACETRATQAMQWRGTRAYTRAGRRRVRATLWLCAGLGISVPAASFAEPSSSPEPSSESCESCESLPEPAPSSGATGTPQTDIDVATAGAPDEAAPARFLPGAIAAGAGSARAMVAGWGGYDGATHVPLASALTEARLGARVVIGAGATYAPGNDLRAAALRPSALVRVQVLEQARHGIDAGLALAYRQDRYVGEDGFFQASAAFGFHDAHGAWLAHVAYGQDGEGDDHEGELRLAGLGRIAGALHVGLDARLRKSLGSTDPFRTQHGTPSLDYMLTPALVFAPGPLAFVLEGGLAGAHVDRLRNGAVVLGGLGTMF